MCKQARFLNQRAFEAGDLQMVFIFLSHCRYVAYLSGRDTRTLEFPALKISGPHLASAYVPRRKENATVSKRIVGLWRVSHNSHKTSK